MTFKILVVLLQSSNLFTIYNYKLIDMWETLSDMWETLSTMWETPSDMWETLSAILLRNSTITNLLQKPMLQQFFYSRKLPPAGTEGEIFVPGIIACLAGRGWRKFSTQET